MIGYQKFIMKGVTSMSKRLEEIKGIIHSWLAWDSWNDKQMDVLTDILVYMEQAERVQELESKLDRIRFVNNDYDKQNKRYRERIMTSIEELELVLYSEKSNDVKEIYLKNAVRFLNEALEGDPK